jgi:translation initiation factor 1A
VLKEDEQEYAQILKNLGNCRFEGYCFDGKNRLLHVPGRFRKRVWINRDDVVLVGLRDYQDAKADIIHKYNPDEVQKLKKMGEIPAKAAIAESDLLDDEDDLVDFDAGEGDLDDL